MATTQTKRPLPAKVAAMKARKRRKLDDTPAKVKVPGKSVRKTGLKADALAWKDISMPDHLDDYEGFFGLEEVEDVDVVRDEKDGRISFAATAVSEPNGDSSKGAINVKAGGKEPRPVGDDELSGFGDEDPGDVTSKPLIPEQIVDPLANRLKAANSKQTKSAKHELSEGAKDVKRENGTFNALANPNEGAEVDISAWQYLKLSPDTLAALSKLQFSKPTPIQHAAVPEILSGHDVIGKASTGSGKTLAFGIPILEAFLENRRNVITAGTEKTPLALILSPTRELAHQLDKHLSAICSNGLFEGPSIATLTGGLSIQKQQRQLKNADIVIGTPGRLWEVISEGQGVMRALKGIQFLVVDEADRLLSEGHFKEVEEILNALDREEEGEEKAHPARKQQLEKPPRHSTTRQTLVFSATFDRGLQRKLASKGKPGGDPMSNKQSLEYLLNKLNFHEEQPKFIDVNPANQLATGLKEGLVECGGTEKDLYLYTLLLLHPNTRTLVFANSINAVRRLTPLLQNLNLSVLGLHSGMPQKARLRSVERFTQTKGGNTSRSILVATDVAARGLDIANVQLVVHYHLPRAADTYVHRSGRTARAGQPGSSVLMCSPNEVGGVRRLVAKVHASNLGSAESGGRQGGYYIRTLDLDRRIVTRLKPRATLAKKIADATIAKEKTHKEGDFLRAAAEELGVDYDSESFDAEPAKGKRGRGSGRMKKEKEAAGLSKSEVGAMKAELKELLKQRVNAGVSAKYLTSGGVDVDELLRQQGAGVGGEFLGSVQALDLL